MQELLSYIIYLNFSTSLMSPVILALALIALGEKYNGLRKAFALLLGVVAVCLVPILLGVFAGSFASVSSEVSLGSAISNILIGLFFLAVAVKFLFDKNYKVKTDKGKTGFLKWFLISVVLEITNFGALAISFNTAKQVSAMGLAVFEKIVLLLVNLVCFALPALLPILFYLLFRKTAEKVFPLLNRFFLKNLRWVIVIAFGLFGIVFLTAGIGFFL